VVPRESFDRDLRQLQKQLLVLGETVDEAIAKSIDTLAKRDLALAQKLVADDALINKARYKIEERCLELIATQQPTASDLRLIIAVLHISTELERMADHAEGIAKITLMVGEEPLLKPLIDIPRMAQKARDMLKQSLKAFVEHDAAEAERICGEDDEVDALYDQVYRELLIFMLQDPRTISRATHLIWVAHNLERIADRVTNICERIIFWVTGELKEIKVSKY